MSNSINYVVDRSGKGPGINYPIYPIHIKGPIRNAFGNTEADAAATRALKLFQERRDWVPLTPKEFEGLKHPKSGTTGLNDPFEPRDLKNPIVLCDDGFYRATHDFISTAHRASPARS